MEAPDLCRKFIFVLPFAFLFITNPSDLFAQAQANAREAISVSDDRKVAAVERYERTNADVKDLYSATLALLEGVKAPKAFSYKKSLVASQNGWLSYRSGHCQLIATQTEETPTSPDAAYYLCIAEINQNRIQELKELQNNLRIEFGL